jgi:RHH-type proline utilization regulon transcriptional repressor/proline dehydrogenase/delta 1-pyrroline-5-carboxylate dehydrogenase
VVDADAAVVERMYALAADAQPQWDAMPAAERGARLERAAELMEEKRAELIALLAREGGKCVPDADAEVREAADYCRYYAHCARQSMAAPAALPGPTGESNELAWHGRGVFACMSPWNFPLAIFTGQVTAALAAGNAVIAKPANQTPLIASAAVKLLHRAGVPVDVLHLAPGPSSRIGAALLEDPRLAGVVMTGSTESAQAIHRALAARPGPILPLIAETGGQNAMIVDSSALPEQAAADALRSAFNSAGQRCSALRVLFLQEEVAARVLRLLTGAIEELTLGDPALIATDVGPVIDSSAQAALEAHAARMDVEGRLLARTPLPEACAHGSFFAPRAYEIGRIGLLEREVFGPILHVVRYAGNRLDAVIDAINATGYGLTLGVHSRIDATVRRIRARARVGNIYVNRNQIGAVVGVQPFGGEGLSGTGPKAGGPHYVRRFALERTFTVNTAAVGGNAVLLGSMED